MPDISKLDGIDISKWQGDINLSKVPCDFVIVKATQANNYVNPYFTKKVDEALALNKLVGVYHYCASGVGAKN
jgi:GH25 family lysozyme M1 (1,4-beta-N-acetylmuramidase)